MSVESNLPDTETLSNIIALKAMNVVRSLHLLRYPKKYVPWRLVKNNNCRNFGFREGEWYLDWSELYLNPDQSLSQKAEFIAYDIAYIRKKEQLTDPQELREYLALHSGFPEEWAGKIEYRDDNFRVLTPDEILPPQTVWRRMVTAKTVAPEPLAGWLEEVAATDFTPIPDRPPNVIIPKIRANI